MIYVWLAANREDSGALYREYGTVVRGIQYHGKRPNKLFIQKTEIRDPHQHLEYLQTMLLPSLAPDGRIIIYD